MVLIISAIITFTIIVVRGIMGARNSERHYLLKTYMPHDNIFVCTLFCGLVVDAMEIQVSESGHARITAVPCFRRTLRKAITDLARKHPNVKTLELDYDRYNLFIEKCFDYLIPLSKRKLISLIDNYSKGHITVL